MGDMKETAFEQGMLVEHKTLGLGKIVIASDKLHIFFKDYKCSYENSTNQISMNLSIIHI